MKLSPRVRAILQAVFVTILWSISWVLIKRNISDIPPLLFAGLRYMAAFLVLSPGLWLARSEVKTLSAVNWRRLVLLGIVYYALTQGFQFLTLTHLDTIPFSLILNFTPLLVAVFGMIVLGERLTLWQWTGIFVFLAGVILYFAPRTFLPGSGLGYLFAVLTLLSNAGASLIGRSVNRTRTISPFVVTALSMGVGAVLLLGAALVVHGLPALSLRSWGVILLLAVVNTAFAFLLWNKSLQVLAAVESSIINNTMVIQIAVLAWLFLGERLDALSVAALLLALAGVVLVTLKRVKTPEEA